MQTATQIENANSFRRRATASVGFQVLLILFFWQAGEFIARALHAPLPGSIIALGLLLVLLGKKIISAQVLQRGAQWFLAELMLFLLPSVLAPAGHRELFGVLGLKLLGAILSGTLVVMVVTALVVDLCHRLITARNNKIA